MILPFLFCILFFLTGCGPEEVENGTDIPPPPGKEMGCVDCHASTLDRIHQDIACTTCHGGRATALSAEKAHENLIRYPAHPDHMMQSCGPCHGEQVGKAEHSLHFTMKQEVNTVRRAFGAKKDLDSLVSVPQLEEIASIQDLADDMLRRRCLRCHLYFPGDKYGETTRGTGCAACHLEFSAGRAASHAFVGSPADSQCLHCHYGNFVGADYHGRFEHDFHWDYRTPYPKTGESLRPYGVEYHQLSPDVHQKAGLACIDCHRGPELMASNNRPSCASCHFWQPGQPLPGDNLHEKNNTLVLITRHHGKKLPVPPALHPAHVEWKNKASCAVCHAQWAFTDEGTHLLRLDAEEFDPWEALSVQGSKEVESQIVTSLYGDESLPYIFMTDTITGELYSGVWLQGYEVRRWEFPIVCADAGGMLHICRPILDLHLSYVNEEEDVIFDAVKPGNAPPRGLVPYAPHTIGKAGPFYKIRLHENTFLLQQPLNMKTDNNSKQTP
ncbi:MAG: hypothetical protein V1706_11320 [Pseudomonadota bacterium]